MRHSEFGRLIFVRFFFVLLQHLKLRTRVSFENETKDSYFFYYNVMVVLVVIVIFFINEPQH